MRLEARNLSAGYGRRRIITDVDLVIEEQRITGLIGPNGSGKSTLLRVLSRFLKPQRGVVLLDGEVLHALPSREVARKLAFLGQEDAVPDLSVEELVHRGRFPHQSLLRRNAAEDSHAVEWALKAMNVDALRARSLRSLSHGEMRRAWTAMALAQRPDDPVPDRDVVVDEVALRVPGVRKEDLVWVRDLHGARPDLELHERRRHGGTLLATHLGEGRARCQTPFSVKG